MTTARFLYGLVAFVVVAGLIERYDDEHHTNYLWIYGAVIILAYAAKNSARLSAGVTLALAEVGAAGAGGAPATSQKAPNQTLIPPTLG